MSRSVKSAPVTADVSSARNSKPIFVADMTAEQAPNAASDGVKDAHPSAEDVTKELWKIATGEGSEASRVSALRALADIMGLLKPQQQELPEAMTTLLDALSAGLSDQQEWADRVSNGKDS